MIPVSDRPLRFEDHARQEVKHTTCYMCACRCGIKLTLQDGRVRFIQGTRNHPVNQGVLCAKGSAGIMKQYSAAKLRQPLVRRPGTERGEGAFEPISWDRALDLLTARLKTLRSTDPKKLAFFTGRDQMQALTGLWAQQFGTPNWAAHGGFCSVNMAAAGLYRGGVCHSADRARRGADLARRPRPRLRYLSRRARGREMVVLRRSRARGEALSWAVAGLRSDRPGPEARCADDGLGP